MNNYSGPTSSPTLLHYILLVPFVMPFNNWVLVRINPFLLKYIILTSGSYLEIYFFNHIGTLRNSWLQKQFFFKFNPWFHILNFKFLFIIFLPSIYILKIDGYNGVDINNIFLVNKAIKNNWVIKSTTLKHVVGSYHS